MTVTHPPGPGRRNRARSLRRAGVFAAAALFAVALALDEANVIGGAWTASAAIVAMLLAIVACFAGFAALDEVAQRAHYVAWFWGASVALAALPVLGVLAALTGFWREDGAAEIAARIFGESGPSEAFLAGAVLVMVAQVMGYAAWWAVFWLRRS